METILFGHQKKILNENKNFNFSAADYPRF